MTVVFNRSFSISSSEESIPFFSKIYDARFIDGAVPLSFPNVILLFLPYPNVLPVNY
jgi:hypothetical protein